MANLSVEIKRTNQKVHFEGVSDLNPGISIPFDFAPPLGDGAGFGGLELLLMSFAGCASTTIVFLLGRAGKQLTAYSATAEGTRTERPLSLSEIHLHMRIESEDITAADMETALAQAEAMAPVWQALKNNVAIKISFELL